jgi:hypothetical protein
LYNILESCTGVLSAEVKMDMTSLNFEFYRTRHELESRVEMRPLAHLPKEGPAWFCTALIHLGEMLIKIGTNLKNPARPPMSLSQEKL